MKNFLAHTENTEGKPHLLVDHLKNVSKIMQQMACMEEYQHVLKVTGLVHDFGKFQDSFQEYLVQGGIRGSVPHASLGAAFCGILKHQEAAFAIDGHHKGLPNLAKLQIDIDQHRINSGKILKHLQEVFCDHLGIEVNDLIFKKLPIEFTKSERELFIRYIFSALTDADWLDTENHYYQWIGNLRKSPKLDLHSLTEKLNKEFSSKPKYGKINQLRNSLRDYALKNANQPVGFFSLTLPTGMGKTLTSIAWAIAHAKFNNLNRIIIVLPFINIIDQTASELKRIFGDEMVLEHHSDLIEDNIQIEQSIASESPETNNYVKRLAIENWDYPIIITTTVQFFESLFSNKPSKCRKVHNIAKSVVIFDEVQTFRKEIVLPTLAMLKDVQKVLGTTFLFCTATQPAFEKRENFEGIGQICPLAKDLKSIFQKVKRVEYFLLNQLKPLTLDELAQWVRSSNESVLIIFNTKKKARDFFKMLDCETEFRMMHLSTNMFPAHRKRVLHSIKEFLLQSQKIIVVSTQLIEAGVDLDFPVVFREIAPLESIIQSAGRCNREGRLPELGKVYIFSLIDETSPDYQYRSLAQFAASLYHQNIDLLNDPEFFTEYYRKALHLFVEPDKFHINQAREEYRFEDVAELYRVIESKTHSLFVYCEETKSLYESIENKPMLSRRDYQLIQQYSIPVFDNFFRNSFEKVATSRHGFFVWFGGYSEQFGISDEMNDLII